MGSRSKKRRSSRGSFRTACRWAAAPRSPTAGGRGAPAAPADADRAEIEWFDAEWADAEWAEAEWAADKDAASKGHRHAAARNLKGRAGPERREVMTA
ncbi:hypothetical protein GCM10023237_05020 [Streptomyces coeruleoprunus]